VTPLDALFRCQRAWEATQPQLFFELWPDGLDEPQTSALRFVEPAVCLPTSPGGGLAAGAEPCRDLVGADGVPSLLTAAPAHGQTERLLPGANGAAAGASAPPINQTAPGRRSPQGMRSQGQEVTV
jgi:hypothetical protein